jgi:hypothetical protein
MIRKRDHWIKYLAGLRVVRDTPFSKSSQLDIPRGKGVASRMTMGVSTLQYWLRKLCTVSFASD